MASGRKVAGAIRSLIMCGSEVEKRDEIGHMFEECMLGILDLSETKLKEDEK